MTEGDSVRVYPHGYPDESLGAEVAIVAQNQHYCALRLYGLSDWVYKVGRGVGIDPELLVPLLLFYRDDPTGPWREYFGDGYFDIEERPRTTRSPLEG